MSFFMATRKGVKRENHPHTHPSSHLEFSARSKCSAPLRFSLMLGPTSLPSTRTYLAEDLRAPNIPRRRKRMSLFFQGGVTYFVSKSVTAYGDGFPPASNQWEIIFASKSRRSIVQAFKGCLPEVLLCFLRKRTLHNLLAVDLGKMFSESDRGITILIF